MQDSNLRTVNLDLLPPYIDALMPEELFKVFMELIHGSIGTKNIGGLILTAAQRQAIEEWISDEAGTLFYLVYGWHLGELDRFIRGIENEDLSLQLKDKF